MKRFTIFGLVLAVAIVTGLNFADIASAQKERSDTTFESTEDSVRSPESVLLTEDFTYAAGSLISANGWTVYSGAPTSPMVTSAPGLTYTGYAGSGIGNAVVMATSGEDASRPYAPQSSGTVYASVLVNLSEASVDPAGGYFFHIGADPVGTAFRCRTFVKKDGSNNLSFGISKASTTEVTFTPFSYALNTTHLLVAKYSIVAGDTNDTCVLFVNPTLGGAEPAATVTATDVTAADIIPGTVSLRQGATATAPTLTVDGIRIGTAWADIAGGGGGGGPAVGPKLFNARLNGANENPANATTGYGYGRVVLNADETQVTVSVYWNGLTGNATAGHIHGPALPTANGPVILNLAPSAAVSGSVVNSSFAVTPTQVADMKAGLWYFNIHTVANPGGEIRGQIGKNTPRFDTDGDGDSDYGIVRPGSGGAGGVTTWYTSLNSGTPNDPHTVNQWGTNADVITPGDFDGDGKDDIAFWRPTGTPAFFILRSSTSTLQQVTFGLQGDDPTIVGDYSGDGKDDPAIYRAGATASSQSFFWTFPSSGPLQNVQVVQAWGVGSDFAVPGDYDGDGRHDLVVARNIGGVNTFIMFSSQSQISFTSFGIGSGASPDRAVPGDYDGDGRTDFAVTRNEAGGIAWWYRPSAGGPDTRVGWGVAGSDIEAQGDYDGNGTTDPAIWRPAGGSMFFALTGPTTVRFQRWGLATDQPSIYDLHGE
ncbi:MAG: CHRD domain-containing protein [Pyrinomonadaceae bacterium]